MGMCGLQLGMTICTRRVGPRQVWHPSGAGLEINLWVHPNPPRGQDVCQFAPIGAHQGREPKTYLIEFFTFLSKPVGTRNTLETRPETSRVRVQYRCGYHFPPDNFLG
jgi:hypothetical protein